MTERKHAEPEQAEEYVPPPEGVPAVRCPSCGRMAPAVATAQERSVDGVLMRERLDVPGYHGTACSNAR